MGFEYLKGKHWSEVTRDERFFCAELYFCIKQDIRMFIKWLKDNERYPFNDRDLNTKWEIGFEVCFYRDYIQAFDSDNSDILLKRSSDKNKVKSKKYSPKRTFDLCLFSESKIVIIEAKAQQGFNAKQNKEFKNDKKDINRLIGNHIEVGIIALASSIYFNNVNKYGNQLPEVFGRNNFSWKEMAKLYNNKLFIYADRTYASSKKLEQANRVNDVINQYFKNNTEINSIQAKEIMPHLIDQRIFKKDHRKGFPIRELLRYLDRNDLLELIPTVRAERKKKNTFWFFDKPNRLVTV